jgi:phosphoglucosamine mutase
MSRRYFGTDGVRGAYGGPVVNDDFAARLGQAVGKWLNRGGSGAGAEAAEVRGSGRESTSAEGRVLIGRDTRGSGVALAAAVARGLRAAGVAPVSLGVVPTPAVALAVQREAARAGAVITASHNPAADNGIKFFGAGGVKLSDDDELAIETLLDDAPLPPGDALLEGISGAAEAYVAQVGALLPPRSLAGWRIVLDTANGSTCGTSPAVLRGLGADVIGLGDTPDGCNINAGVGSEFPEPLAARVRAEGARVGIAHDGDGDRCVLCDEAGGVLDGDEILTILAVEALARGRLAGNLLVTTVQSNLGVEAAVAAAGGRVLRTPVGDRYVIARMLAEGANLGGESSGHIVCTDVAPTGDGLVAALRILEVMQRTGQRLSELRRVLRKFPQRAVALPVVGKPPLESLRELAAAREGIVRELGAGGRVLVRYSGTEAKLRLLVEGPTDAVVAAALERLQAAVRRDGLWR